MPIASISEPENVWRARDHRQHYAVKPPLTSPELFQHLAHQRREVCAVSYLDETGLMLGMRHFRLADVNAARISMRAIAGDAVAFDAQTVMMAHNHPSGNPSPSAADIEVTRALARALDALGMTLADHLVMVEDGHFSFRAAGLL